MALRGFFARAAVAETGRMDARGCIFPCAMDGAPVVFDEDLKIG